MHGALWHEQHRVYYPFSGIIRVNAEKHTVDVIRQFLDEEYAPFPLCAHDDGLDSLSWFLDEDMGISTKIQPLERSSGIEDDAYGAPADPNTSWMTG